MINAHYKMPKLKMMDSKWLFVLSNNCKTKYLLYSDWEYHLKIAFQLNPFHFLPACFNDIHRCTNTVQKKQKQKRFQPFSILCSNFNL